MLKFHKIAVRFSQFVIRYSLFAFRFSLCFVITFLAMTFFAIRKSRSINQVNIQAEGFPSWSQAVNQDCKSSISEASIITH